MARYAFHDLTLEVASEEGIGEELHRLLRDLSWEPAPASNRAPSLTLEVFLDERRPILPPDLHEVFRAEGLRGLEGEDDFYLTDGASLMRLEPGRGRGEIRLARSFFLKPPRLRQDFWIFALLKLLRPMEIYGLHAAGLVAEDGRGVLVIGESGSGKSTLAIALIRLGWRYLSDDAVLLRRRSNRVEALALRKHVYVDAAGSGEYAHLPFGEEKPDRHGGRRRRLRIEAAYPSRQTSKCVPDLLLFPRIVGEERSVLRPVDRVNALGHLLAQSGPQLFDRATSARHLALLDALLRQSTACELRAGLDLCRDPMAPKRLFRTAEGGPRCLASS